MEVLCRWNMNSRFERAVYHYPLVLGYPFLNGGPLEFPEHVGDTAGATMDSHCESGIPAL